MNYRVLEIAEEAAERGWLSGCPYCITAGVPCAAADNYQERTCEETDWMVWAVKEDT